MTDLIDIPTRVDDPPHILLWSADELAPILLGMVAGIMFEQLTICVLLGWLVTKQYSKFCDNHPDGYMFHVMYWYGLAKKRRSMPITAIRRFFP